MTPDVKRSRREDLYGMTTMVNKFDVLKEMARSDNIAVIYSDFTNPDLITSIRDLPGFQGSRNIIYMSNIADHIARAKDVNFIDVWNKMESLY